MSRSREQRRPNQCLLAHSRYSCAAVLVLVLSGVGIRALAQSPEYGMVASILAYVSTTAGDKNLFGVPSTGASVSTL